MILLAPSSSWIPGLSFSTEIAITGAPRELLKNNAVPSLFCITMRRRGFCALSLRKTPAPSATPSF
jgi:hypothetical protein